MRQRLELKYHARTWPATPSPQDAFWLFHLALPYQRGVLAFFMEWSASVPHSLFSPIFSSIETQSKTCLQSIAEDKHAQYRFEQLLECINGVLDEFYKKHPHIAEHMHLAIGLFLGEQFFFSGHGNTCALFLRRTGADTFRVFDLALNVMSEAGHAGHYRPLRTVLDGTWEKNDACVLGSSHIPKSLPLETLHPWLTQLPPVTVEESIDQAFHPEHMGLFLVQMSPEKPSALVGVEGELGSRESLEKLHNLVVNTRKEVSATGQNEFAQSGNRWRKLLDTIRASGQRFSIRLRPLLRASKKTFFSRAARLPHYLWQARKRLGSALRLRKERHIAPVHTARSARPLLPWRTVGVGILTVLLGATGWHWQRTAAHDHAFSQTLTTAETQVQSARNTLMYNDSARTRQTLQAASASLAPLAPRTESQRLWLERVRGAIHDVEARSEGRRTPTIATTTFTASPLAQTGTLLLLADGSVWDIQGQSPSPRTASNGPALASALGATAGFFAMEQGNQNSSVRRDPDFLPKKTDTWKEPMFDWFSYSDRLYTVSASGIWRRPYNADGSLSSATAWLGTPTSFTAPVSLAVDTTIWLVSENRLRTFQAGKEQENTFLIQPPLERVQDVFTTKELPWLFVLDQGGGGRVIVVDKKTKNTLAQYTDTRFTKATHLWVDPQGKTVSVVSGNTLMVFPLDV